MSGPKIQHFTAVASPKTANTILFQVNDKYQLSFYESTTPDETKRKKYDFQTLKVGGKKIEVNHEQPIIAAVAFAHQNCCNGQEQVRLYYVAEKDNVLQELQRTGGPDGKWEEGEAFNGKGYEIVPKSGLTANVVPLGNNDFAIKVYYQASNKDDYADVIYNVFTASRSDEWSTRPNVTEA